MSTFGPDTVVATQPQLSPFRPYGHQSASWDALSRDFRGEARAGLLVLPTGGGKTFVAAHWLLANHIREGGRVLWLAHRRALLRQAARAFLTHCNVAHPKPRVGTLRISSADGKWSMVRPDHDVVLSSIQTASREEQYDFIDVFMRMGPEPRRPLFVVVDEAHHASAPSYYRLLTKLRQDGCPLLGLTATPVRMDETDERRLHALFDGHIVHQVERPALIDQGILAVPSFETVETKVDFEREFTEDDLRHLERYGELAPNVLSRLATHASRNALIVRQYQQNAAKYGHTIIFAADVLHARTLASELQQAGVSADYVDYGRGDSQQVIEAYQSGHGPKVLVNVEMLTEGFDAPHTRTVFLARPTRSEGLLSQMVGRALRGPRSGGNERAYLVTFVDTWKQFEVLDLEYVLQGGEVEEPESKTTPRGPTVPIPHELVHEVYRLLMSAVTAETTGIFECLPCGWYAWEETLEDDARRRLVMVYEHQREGYAALLEKYPSAESVREKVSDDAARQLVQDYFGDLPDPLPRWTEVQALLEARRNGADIVFYTFDDKKGFDPKLVAQQALDRALTPTAQRDHLIEIWEANAACRSVYRQDFRRFQDEVSAALNDLLEPPRPPTPPEVIKSVPRGAPPPWPVTEPGYSLVRIRDDVVSIRKNFPSGPPSHGPLEWSRRPSKATWGFYRHSDRKIVINCVLDSPDMPLYVLEFLMFHELLHAEMPHAGHDADFRQRERAFVPSDAAVQDAEKRGIEPGKAPGAWRALADMFLDTFEHHYAPKKPGSVSY